MNPPTEQLIRDYLNRVSVAARGRLSAEERRAFLARTREFIEQNTRALGRTDSADVVRLLSELGDPAALVGRERDRLAGRPADTTGFPAGDPGVSPAGDAATGARPTRGPRRWRSAKGTLADRMAARAAAVPPGQAIDVPEPAADVPMTGEIQFQTRPITSRWRPGASMVPKPPRQRRVGIPRRLQAGVPGEAQEQPGGGDQPGRVADEASAGSPPPLPADMPPRPRRNEWPSTVARRPETDKPAPPNGQPPAGEDASPNGPSRPDGIQASGARPGAAEPDAPRSRWKTPPSGTQPGTPANGAPGNGAPADGAPGNGSPGKGTPGNGTPGNGAAVNGAQPNGTLPKGSPPGSVPAQATPVNGVQPDGPEAGGPAVGGPAVGGPAVGGPAAGGSEAGGVPGGPEADGAPSGGRQAGPAAAGGVSSSDLVAGRAPGRRRLAAVARGSGWASGVRARGTRAVGAMGVGARGPGERARGDRTGREHDARSARQPGGPPSEEPLSGLWPDLGAIGAAVARVARSAAARARRRPLEATAVVLLGLGGLIYPPVWLMGAAVALLSKVWDIRDKWIGLALPVFLVIVGMVVDVSLGGKRPGLSGYVREAWIFGGHISRLVAVLGAVYLARRAERGRRTPPVAPWNKPRRFG